MDNKMIRGKLIRGAFAMAPVKNILFNNNTIPPADNFNDSWDDLSPGTQENWTRIAVILESVIKSELWRQAAEPSLQELADDTTVCKDCHCVRGSNQKNCPTCSLHVRLFPPIDDRCQQCKEFDNDGCPNCGPNTIRKVFDPADNIPPLI